MANALREAERLGLDTVQVFTKNQRQWAVKPLDDGARDEWLAELTRLGWADRTVSHNSYLINTASPNDELRDKSIALQREEIERCERLSIPLLVWHPGSHTGSGEDAGLRRIADACAALLRETRGYRTVLCVENTVGSGANLGGPFEHLRALREMVIERAGDEGERRFGFCFDTCHAHAYGHDMSSEAAAMRTLDALDHACGLANVRVVHLNDSKGARGSRLDRHEHIGKGTIGEEGFGAVVNHPALRGAPMILETPKEDAPSGEPWDALNLRLLRRMRNNGRAARRPAKAGAN